MDVTQRYNLYIQAEQMCFNYNQQELDKQRQGYKPNFWQIEDALNMLTDK